MRGSPADVISSPEKITAVFIAPRNTEYIDHIFKPISLYDVPKHISWIV